MNITIPPQDKIDSFEDIMIHFFYHVLKYDYRSGLFTDESSIFDMGSTGLDESDYLKAYHEYHDSLPKKLSYIQCQKHYYKILYRIFDEVVAQRVLEVYDIELPKKINLLVDIAAFLKDNVNKNWQEENIFLIKTMDTKSFQKFKLEDEKKFTNVIPIPIKKKLSDEDVAQGCNEFLMMSRLNMSWDDARVLAKKNYEKSMEGKIFEPYLPSTIKPSMKLK